MTHDQINVELWKLWEPYFGHETEVGRTLLSKQASQFQHECMGVPITAQQLERMQGRNSTSVYPFLFPGTTSGDFNEAQWVMNRPSTLYSDLDNFRQNGLRKSDDDFSEGDFGDVGDDFDGNGFEALGTMSDKEGFLSNNTNQLRDAMELSAVSTKLTSEEEADCRKEYVEFWNTMKSEPRADVLEFLEEVRKLKDEKKRQITRRDGYLKTSDNSFQWSGMDTNDTTPEKRRKGCAG